MNVIEVTSEGAKCLQCNKSIDLLAMFTKHPVCGKCTRKNHTNATK